MDLSVAADRRERGLAKIDAKRSVWRRREDYYRGRQDLPYAPPGVSAEYLQLREMAGANWLALAMDTPTQRLRADGFRTGRDEAADATTWNEVWQPNNLDSRQRIVYSQMFVHGRGLMSVWPNPSDRKSPVIRPESSERVHVQMDPEDPFTAAWAVKSFTVEDRPVGSNLIVPGSVASPRERQVAVVYDRDSWVRFERGGSSYSGEWTVAANGSHPLGAVPFVTFDHRQDADGQPWSAIEPLMQQQDALNTIRFQTLLAMQFAAYRQRAIVGYDPVIRDQQGQPLFELDGDGKPVLDAQGRPKPLLQSMGRAGVDRILAFPGADTKVFDMPESNLANYITVLGEFLSDLFALGQVPPQYLLNRMSNLSGDALAGAESTLQSLVADLQRTVGESLEEVMRLANRARGEDEPDLASEVVWADAEARSFAQTVDGITKLVTVGLPRQAAFEMVPGATPVKVRRWMELSAEERRAAAVDDPIARAAEALRVLPPAPEVEPVA